MHANVVNVLNKKNFINNSTTKGFTIVELLIVVVVIAILAAVTIVAYNGISNQTKEAALKTDLNNAIKQLHIAKVENGSYPVDASGIKKSDSTTFEYSQRGDSGFCLAASRSDFAGEVFRITEDGNIESGDCGVLVSTLAGSSAGYADGTGASAKFSTAYGIAIDSSGTLYLADSGNNRIRAITAGGVVTTLAGSSSGFADGTGASAKFNFPQSIAVDSSGNIYVADTNNHKIRKITTGGVVTTLAGSSRGYADGTGAAAQFNYPFGIAVDSSGNIYVADYNNYKIRKITSAGVVTTLAGSTSGYADGTGAAAQFNHPTGVATDSSGNIYVTDNTRIRKVTPGGVVTTVAGGSAGGFADGTGASAKFNNPQQLVCDSSGNIYTADYGNSKIRKIAPDGTVTTIAGSTVGYTDGAGLSAQFSSPLGITISTSGTLYVADGNNYKIRKIQ